MKIANDILIPEIERLLKDGKEVRFTPSGVSMRPFIEGDRDSVILTSLSRSPRIGDILLVRLESNSSMSNVKYQMSPTFVLHRLVRIEGDTLVLQGDGNLVGEERCGASDIIGIVKRIESPSARRKPLTRGRLWYHMRRWRWLLLKVYRHIVLKMYK
jgi:hypothetical protein